MSRKKNASVAVAVAAEPGRGIFPRELFGRFLLGWTAALIVARPLVFGEDPGLSQSHTDTASLVLSLSWLCIAVTYACWCLWSRRPFGPLNGVEWGLLAVVACVFVSAHHAPYRYPARLIAWEWVGFLVVYGVVRRLANQPAARDGLRNVLLASVVALSAHGVYQGAMELRQDRERYGDTDELKKAVAQQNPSFAPNERRIRLLQRGLLDERVFGTYVHPDSYAEVLVLFLPGLVGAFWIGFRCRLPTWQVSLLAAGAVLAMVALWMTRSRGALLGLGLAACLALALWQRRWLVSHKAGWLAAVAGAAAAAACAYQGGWWPLRDESGFQARRDYWRATARMIADKPWWGFGPGNFGNAYGRYMAEGAAERITDPHNFLLEMWVTAGILATMGLLAARGLAFRGAARGRADNARRKAAGGETSQPGSPTHFVPSGPGMPAWVFYLGGAVGLLFGFGLRVGELPPETVVREFFAAAGRSALWFAFCGLLMRIKWTPRAGTEVLTTGAGAMLVAMTFSGGLSFPAVAMLLWAVLALAAPLPAAAERNPGSLALLAMPALAAAALFYFLTVVHPVTAGANEARETLSAIGEFHNADFMTSFGSMERLDTQKSAGFIRKRILAPLAEALQKNPDNAWLHTLRANWLGVLWTQVAREKPATRVSALQAAARAEALNPEGPEPCLMRCELLMLFGETTMEAAKHLKKRDPKLEFEAQKDFRAAARALEQHIRLNPRDPLLRFQLARAAFLAGETSKAQVQAGEAKKLNNMADDPSTFVLSDEQIKQLDAWLEAPLAPDPLTVRQDR